MNKQSNIRKLSILTGLTLILMLILATFAMGYVQNTLYIEGDPIKTLENIQNQQYLFNMGLVALTLIFITDLIVSYTFYSYLKEGNKKVALLSGLLRFIYTFILGYGIYILTSKNYEAFNYIWYIGLIIFGLHLIATGYGGRFIKEVPKGINLLLIIAGVAYTLIHTLYVFFPSFDNLTNIIQMVFM